MSVEHRLKTWPEHFEAVVNGMKTAEIRKDDRGFVVGDTLILEEWEPITDRYTGRTLRATISHIVRGAPFLPDDTAMLSLTRPTFKAQVYGGKTVGELWALAGSALGPSDTNIVLINRLAFGKAMISALPELLAEIDELCGHLDKILDFCESGKWEHSYDGDDYSEWVVCDGREMIEAMARDALAPAAAAAEPPQ